MSWTLIVLEASCSQFIYNLASALMAGRNDIAAKFYFKHRSSQGDCARSNMTGKQEGDWAIRIKNVDRW